MTQKTHLEPEILEYEFKWTFTRITTNKARGGDGIPAQLFQILKDAAAKVLHPICQQIWENSAGATELEKVSFHSRPQKRAKPKNVQTTAQLHSFHMLTSKVMLKVFQARLQQYVNREIPDV